MSEFKSLSPRIQIRERDNHEGRYPTQTVVGTRTYGLTSSFSDDRTLFFTASTITWPQGLPVSSLYVSETYLTGQGNVVRGVADSQIYVTTSLAGFTPYTEDGRFALAESQFYATGSHEDDRLNCKLRDKVEIRIDIPTTTNAILTRSPKNVNRTAGGFLSGTDYTGFTYYNFRLKRWEMIGLTDPETGANISFDWRAQVSSSAQNIVSGTELFPAQFISYHGLSPTWNGDAPLSATHLTALERQEVEQRRAIGSPTVVNFAPFANKYHATSSQGLRMSRYIDRPFLLEKVVVRLPIEAERRSDSAIFFSSSNYTLPQEDYVFFIYRQERNFYSSLEGTTAIRSPVRRQAEYATGSSRFLICSGVMTFYNSIVRWPHPSSGTLQFGITNYKPLNTPAFSHNWGVATASNVAAANVAVFTGSVTLEMPVAVASPSMKTSYNLFSSTASHIRAEIQHYWPGGTSALPFGPNNIPGKLDILGTLRNVPAFGNPTFTFFSADGSTVPDFNAAKEKMQIEHLDPRARKFLGGLNASSGSFGYQQSAESPYLLMPEDELVFGLEAALGPLSLYVSGGNHTYGSIENVTGSLLKVTPGHASVTLYGSLLRNDQPYDPGRSQFLTTENVNEAIIPQVYDTKEIKSNFSYAGNIFDLVFTGSFADDPPRRVFGLDSLFGRHVKFLGNDFVYDLFMTNQPQPPSSSIDNGAGSKVSNLGNQTFTYLRRRNRVTKIIDANERFYDSVPPSISKYLVSSSATAIGQYTSSSAITVTNRDVGARIFKFAGGSDSRTFAFLEKTRLDSTLPTLKPNPYAGNPERPQKDEKIFIACSATSPASVPYFEFVFSNQDMVKMLLFSRGYRVYKIGFSEFNSSASVVGPSVEHDLVGSSQAKYGMTSFLPHYSSQVYNQFHYGQFRDKLEQRAFTVFQERDKGGKRIGPVTVRFWDSRLEQFVTASTTTLSGSSNRSTEATSSLPYVDGEYSNWSVVF